MIGYTPYNDDRSFDKAGITDKVTRYARGTLSYPCYIIVSTKEAEVKYHNIETLNRMFPSKTKYDSEKMLINIYLSIEDKLAKLGVIQSNQVKTFLDLFRDNEVKCYLSEDNELTGMYKYVLSD